MGTDSVTEVIGKAGLTRIESSPGRKKKKKQRKGEVDDIVIVVMRWQALSL